MDIRTDDLNRPEVAELLLGHLENMSLHSPPESVHALGLDAFRSPDLALWSAWEDDELLGCGALKELDAKRGEIKSMLTAEKHLRRGVAAGLLEHIIGEARRRGYRRLSLETGSMEAFAPARALYQRFGFDYCGPFAGYVEDPYSVFMTKTL